MNKLLCLLFVFLLSQSSVLSLDYDYSSTKKIPIKMSITEEISTKSDIIEGQKVDFLVLNDVKYNGQTIVRKGDIVKGNIETLITSGMNGFPAEIIVDNFEFPGIPKTKLVSTYTKAGHNRCFWVYPLKWALTPIPFVGSLTNFIKGGHARLKPSDIITVYYYPEWK